MSLFDSIKENPDINFLRKELSSKIRNNRILNNVMVELLPICNFTCPFCYARKSLGELKENGEHVLSFEEWKPIFDQLSEMGVHNITITGGECTLHKEFCKIYTYLYELGFEITVFTNCSNITDEMLEMFDRMPPVVISTTVYAASPEGYKKICGNSNYYDRVIKNIRILNDHRFRIVVKQTISNDNIKDCISIYQFAKSLNIKYECSPNLMSFGSCTVDKVESNQVDQKENIDILKDLYNALFPNNKDEKEEKTIYKLKPRSAYISDIPKGLKCGAGNDSVYFNYNGEMTPCVSIEEFAINTRETKVSEAWENIKKWAENVPIITECFECPLYFLCIGCYAAHYNDTKQFGVPSPRLCWKKKHPEKAEKLLKYYDEHGYIMSDMLED